MQVRRYNAAKEKQIGILTVPDKLLFTCFICHIFHMNYIIIPIFFKNNYHNPNTRDGTIRNMGIIIFAILMYIAAEVYDYIWK